MNDDLKPGFLARGQKVVGPTSPVQSALRWLLKFFADKPIPDPDTVAAQSAALALATHLLHLMRGFGFLNLNGYHSVSASLLRSFEDALDCFAAVILVEGSAEKWQAGTLRASEAAKAWTPLVPDIAARTVSLSDYRKTLRENFNDYAHCAPELCSWNLYFSPQKRGNRKRSVVGSLEVNLDPRIIESNAHALDAYAVAHIYEFLLLIKRGYSKLLGERRLERSTLDDLLAHIAEILEEHDKHGCLDIRPPPEIRNLK